ncbi:MAG: pitrilysin family protein [Bryobacteraceae bacterium]
MRLILWALPLAVGTAAAARPAPDLWGGRLTEFRLANGLPIAVLERHTSPIVAFHVHIAAGVADEPEGKAGISRLIERSFWNGTETLGSRGAAEEKALLDRAEKLMRSQSPAAGSDPTQERLRVQRNRDEAKLELAKAAGLGIPGFVAQALGAQGASDLRYFLGSASASFYLTIPSESAEVLFRLWGEWLHRPSWRNFYIERSSLRSEASRQELVVPLPALRQLFAALFPDHRFRNLGSPMDQFENVLASDAADFFRAYYRPGNLAIAIVGDVTAEQAKSWANKHLASIPAREAPVSPAPPASPPQSKSLQRISVAANLPPQVWMAWKRTRPDLPGEATRMVMRAMVGGPSGWLSRQAAAESGLRTVRLESSPSDTDGDDILLLMALSDPSIPLDEVETRTVKLAARLSEWTVSADDISAARKNLRAGLLLRLEDPYSCADLIARSLRDHGSAGALSALLSDIETVTAESVKAAVAQTLLRQPDAIVRTGPRQARVAPPAGEGSK